MKEISPQELQDAVQNSLSFLLHFWAEWNGYDLTQRKILASIESRVNMPQIFQMSIDSKENWPIAKAHEVFSPPTLVYYLEGKLVAKVAGLQSGKQLLELIRPAI